MHLQFTKWILSDSCFWAKKSNFPCLCPCTQSAQPGINIFETKIQSKGFIQWLLRNLWYLFNHAFNGKWEKIKWAIFKKNVLLQNSLFYAINNSFWVFHHALLLRDIPASLPSSCVWDDELLCLYYPNYSVQMEVDSIHSIESSWEMFRFVW